MKFHGFPRLNFVTRRFAELCVFCAVVISSLLISKSLADQQDQPAKSIEQLQKGAINYIEGKSGAPITLPSYPADSLISWSLQSYRNAGEDRPQIYNAVGQQLLVARILLANKNPQQRRRGLRLVHNANFKVAVRLRDPQLSAQMFDGFVMPYLDSAVTGKGTLSRARLLQDAASVYRLAKERGKQTQALHKLIATAESDKDTDGADWGRVKLADVLAEQGLYQEAADQLKAIKASNMSGSKTRIAALEAKAASASKRDSQK